MDHDLIWRLEALYTAAWPPLRRESVGDWLVKFAPGVSRRANSANPLRARLRDVDSSIEACARRYRDSSMPALFRILSILEHEAGAAGQARVPAGRRDGEPLRPHRRRRGEAR